MAAAAATCGCFNLRQTIVPIPTSFVTSLSSSSSGSRVIPATRSVTKQKTAVRASSPLVDDRVEFDENPEGIISGEWTENFSLLCYDDLKAFFAPQIFQPEMRPSTLLREVMSTTFRAATPDQTLEEIDHHFHAVSGLPVIDDDLRCIGIVCKEDRKRATHGLKSRVGEVMTSPPVTLSPEKTVLDAAALMLKMNIYSIAILNEERQVIGFVNHSDILQELEAVHV